MKFSEGGVSRKVMKVVCVRVVILIVVGWLVCWVVVDIVSGNSMLVFMFISVKLVSVSYGFGVK